MVTEKPKIILIENDPLTLTLYERELTRHFEVAVCHSRTHAEQLLAAEPIDLMILEPAQSNQWIWAFLDALAATTSAEIPIIFCTTLDDRKRGQAYGAHAYLVKPVYAHTLREQVEHLLQRRGSGGGCCT